MRETEPTPFLLLRPHDLATLAVVLGSVLVMIWGYWQLQGGYRGALVDIDRAVPLHAKYEVDINKAEWPELVQLQGLGPILAQRLVENRERNGPFADLEDLRRVQGIGPRTLERIRPFLIPIARDTDWAATEHGDSSLVQ